MFAEKTLQHTSCVCSPARLRSHGQLTIACRVGEEVWGPSTAGKSVAKLQPEQSQGALDENGIHLYQGSDL